MTPPRHVAAHWAAIVSLLWIGECSLSLPVLAEDYARLKERPYDVVRGELIDESWKPASPGCMSTLTYYCDVYPELEDCAATGVAPCIFWWEDESGALKLKIYTVGEIKRMISGIETVGE